MIDFLRTYLPIILAVIAIGYYARVKNGGILNSFGGWSQNEKLVLLLIILVVPVLYQCDKSDHDERARLATMTPSQREAAREQAVINDAKYACREAVERKLKAPTTAKFPYYQQFSAYRDGDGYSVSGYVDAQNSFGAMIRTSFSCQMRNIGGSWTALAVTN